jgi:RNA polymerase sigma factor (sigma-70 family)
MEQPMSPAPISPAPEDPTRLEHELLALRCLHGERAAWEELVARWQRPLFYYLRRMLRGDDEAWLVLQDTWLRVFSSLPTLRQPAQLAPWLYAVARNALRQHGAERGAEQGNEGAEPVVLEQLADPEPELEIDAERVHLALAELEPAQREALTLFFLEDLSLAELAQVLEVPLGTVKSRLSAARGALRAALERMESRHG